jgi:hypothetical protein
MFYRGGQFYWGRKPEYLEKTTNLSQVTDKLYHRLRIRESDNCTLAYVALNLGNGQEIGKLLNFKIVKISGIL